MKITKDFLRDIKRASSIVIRFNEYSSIDLSFEGNNSASYNYDNQYSLNGTWYSTLYPDQNIPTSSIIDLLKVNDEISFYREDHSHQNLFKDGYIHDQLIIRIKRYKAKNPDQVSKIMQFIFDTQVTNNKPNLSKAVNYLAAIN